MPPCHDMTRHDMTWRHAPEGSILQIIQIFGKWESLCLAKQKINDKHKKVTAVRDVG